MEKSPKQKLTDRLCENVEALGLTVEEPFVDTTVSGKPYRFNFEHPRVSGNVAVYSASFIRVCFTPKGESANRLTVTSEDSAIKALSAINAVYRHCEL